MSAELEQVKARYPGAQTFKFGDNQALCDELLALVRAGVKTATCGALRDYPEGSADMPKPGRRDIALDWADSPALVIETLEVSIHRFCDVTESFALAEGENDTLDGWRDGHRRYFERNGGFDPAMELVCERFRLVEDLAAKG
ncbi:ASCH domain-containing protein [Tropicibacter sp. R16_0]|uniref:ASCH domain-containing protein n=1 Tax=Tropicibacter sp. R16_0 TaxID=2821102 RepID=UPI001ADD178A|nr:ASCH domain-containing protein [Tropicibacter sp. R16_0]MBO9450236.1 ASCH domain-containing protein [Tropicibacter sp. R16_0]